MKYSIVMSYYNRREQLLKTLRSISCSTILPDNIEIVIVDDCSDEKEKISDLNSGLYGLDIKVIEIDPKDKWWHNPCIPFNIGFKAAKGDIIVIQNPECVHYGDCLKVIDDNIKANAYVNFACYSVNQLNTERILKLDNNSPNLFVDIKEIIYPLETSCVKETGYNGWYCHKEYRPKFYHFLSAVHKEDLARIGYFDERYAEGLSFDDDDLLLRINYNKMNLLHYWEPFAIHLWHYTGNKNISDHERNKLIRKNKVLFNQIRDEYRNKGFK